ncbi:branched-chain amino acid ABC transporter permease [Actinomadura parmotrematis]|uniref:Branched-chain amino acid ABC transporter permease n=1 Tax=Actinomadura parmotrematis TaxID=2864039 RepID=A0ABS7FL53_9ACTN|nr:branched-chain amino acid ABC transporter permease [Actinomadura parmotrematis]MBW8481098.1 branched-chain amino acid ABC transporter permease [Actinomadura parmotrematis]
MSTDQTQVKSAAGGGAWAGVVERARRRSANVVPGLRELLFALLLVTESAGVVTDAFHDWWVRQPGWSRWTVYVLLIIGAILLPAEGVASIMSPDTDWTTLLFFPVGGYILLAIGLNVVVGQAGLLDLGYVAFFAIGGYTMAVFGTKYGWSFWEILLVGIVLSALSGIVLGAPTLRLRGDYLAIVTLGFGEIVRITANNTDYIGGPNGISGIPHPPQLTAWAFPESFPFGLGGVQPFVYGSLDAHSYYYLMLLLIIVTIIFAKRLERSRVGRAWASIREDEDAAELMGVPTFKFKLAAFAIGAAIGGATGVVYGTQAVSIIPTNFPFILSATILAAVVMGGSGNIPGVMVGAFLVAWIPERVRFLGEYRVLVFGAVLVLLMIFRPEGILPSRQRKAEFAEGSGGMGSMGAEVATATVVEDTAELDDAAPAGGTEAAR